jgi:ZIP family zinc transporter
MTAVLLSLAALGSTLCGGLLALRLSHRLHYILAFTAGVLLGVVSFEVLPEVFALAQQRGFDVNWGMMALVVGFLLFHSLEKFVLVHHAHEADYAKHNHPQVGILSALALVGHSALDGVGIGLAFQASHTVGVSVAIAVVAHDFCDGLNTVALMLTHGNTPRRSAAMLALDAVAPVVGAASTLLVQVAPFVLLLYLGFFAGFLLYISVSDILPEAHSRATPATAVRLIGLTVLGSMFVVGTSQFS